MPVSEKLEKHFKKQKPSIEAINRLLPDDIFPEFREQVTLLLSNYQEEYIESEDVKDAIKNWNNRILAVWKMWDKKKKEEMFKAANNPSYVPQELEAA